MNSPIYQFFKNIVFILQGCQVFFEKFLPGFLIFSRFLKVHTLGSIFSLKLNLRLKTVLNSIKILKRYCKATLYVFLNKKISMITKKKLSI